MVNLRELADRGHAAMVARDWKSAVKIYRKILKINPKDASAWSNLGAIYIHLADVEKGEDALNEALKFDPQLAPALGNLANLKKQTGNPKAAERLYRSILKQQPDLPRAWYELTYVKKFVSEDKDISKMETLFEDAKTDVSGKIYLAFALGKALEEVGEYDRAFYYIEYANKGKRATINFEVERFENAVDELIDIFNKTLFDKAKSRGLISKKPIFIVGMPRSGTTLIEQILASHSDVIGAGELENLSQIIAVQYKNFPKDLCVVPYSKFEKVGRLYLKSIDKLARQSKHVTDKMPRNFLFIGMIALALPEAKIVNCLRSPLDTCLSCYALNFPTGQEFSYNQVELGRYYRSYRKLISHWHEVLPNRIFDVNYEDVVAEPKISVEKLLKYCELNWDQRCLDFHQNARQISTASAIQVREPVHQRSVHRWQRFEAGLIALRETLGEYADDV